jgi:hypothetical protein
MWGGLVDLALDASADDQASALLEQIQATDGENEAAFRHGQRYVVRLVPSTDLEAPSAPPSVKSDGTYLITGGLGRLGLTLARWLVDLGARHLIMTGLSGLPDRSVWKNLPPNTSAGKKIAAIQALEEAGATVEAVRADVADLDRMAEVIGQIGNPPLRGVIHAAAKLNGQILKNMELDTLNSMLRPNVLGTWVLHQLTRELDLDFFILFSSTTSFLGAKNLAHYGAANQFLDAFSHYRRALDLPALTINWGAWKMNEGADGE